MIDFAIRRRGLLVGLVLATTAVFGAARAEQPATTTAASADTTVTTFAAASLTNAVKDIGKAYEEKNKGASLQFSFAGSNALSKQIEGGAPANIFASADLKWMDYLQERDLIIPATRVVPIGNVLVMVAPADTAKPITISKDLDIDKLLGPKDHIVLALTKSVPAGIYAKTAFTSLGLWDKVQPHVVEAANVRAALAMVERNEVPFGVVYATDAAIAKNVKVVGVFPAGSHPPVEYPFAILKGRDTPEAKAFFAFLTGPEAKEIYKKYGFSVK